MNMKNMGFVPVDGTDLKLGTNCRLTLSPDNHDKVELRVSLDCKQVLSHGTSSPIILFLFDVFCWLLV